LPAQPRPDMPQGRTHLAYAIRRIRVQVLLHQQPDACRGVQGTNHGAPAWRAGKVRAQAFLAHARPASPALASGTFDHERDSAAEPDSMALHAHAPPPAARTE